ncbi:MAG: hypothetical protein QOD92_560 [Acidimicrobiaceae bacterium]
MNSTPGDVTKLAVLGFLKSGPNHGYGLRAILESWEVHRWLDIKYGAIYATLKRLDEQGFVQVSRVDSDRGPARTIYRLTKKGDAELQRLARLGWSTGPSWSMPIDLLVMFLSYDWIGSPILRKDEVVELLSQRVEALQSSIDNLSSTAEQFIGVSSFAPLVALQRAHFDHGLELLRSELAWTRDLRNSVARGQFDPAP